MGGELVLREEPGGGLLRSYLVAFERAPEAGARTRAAGDRRRLRGASQPPAAGDGAAARWTMKRLRSLWPLVIVVALGPAVPLFRLHFFHTESAPIGLWRALPAAEPRVGQVARFCMRSEEARFTAGGPYAGGRRGGPCPHDTWMLAKPVVAGPGDMVVHAPNGRACQRSRAAEEFHAHARLARPAGPDGGVRNARAREGASPGCTRLTATAPSTAATWVWCDASSCAGRCGRCAPRSPGRKPSRSAPGGCSRVAADSLHTCNGTSKDLAEPATEPRLSLDVIVSARTETVGPYRAGSRARRGVGGRLLTAEAVRPT